MTITFDGAGGIFTRLGHIIQLANNVNAIRGGALTVDGRATDVSEAITTTIDTILADFAAGTALYEPVDGTQQAELSYQSVHSSFLQYLRSVAQDAVIRQVNADTTLVVKDLPSAMRELIRQMVANSENVKANVPALGAQTAVGTPSTGDDPVIVGTIKSGTGKFSGEEYSIAETIKFTCTADAQSGGTSENQESFSVLGKAAQSDLLAQDWPLGSGASGTLTVVDAEQDNAGGNILTNSDFEDWCTDSTSTPQNWTFLVGTAGTDGGKEATAFYTDNGAAAFKFIAGTGVSTSITQKFDTTASALAGAGGTPYDISEFPEKNYAICLWIKRNGVTSAGILTIDLIDGSGNVIADTGGTNNSFTVAHGALTTDYVAFTGVFRLLAEVPTTVKLRIRASTAVAGADILIDHVAMSQMTQLYNGGPHFAIFSSNDTPLKDDAWTMALTISAAGAFQRGFQKLFDMPNLGLYLPSDSAGAHTNAETLIG